MADEKMTTEQIEERKARGAERRRRREIAWAARKVERKDLRDRLATHKNIRYFHLRPQCLRHGTVTRGGICVAVQRCHSRCFVAAVSVCSRVDSYDKLEARHYAFDRLDYPPENIFPTLTLKADAGRAFDESEAVLGLVRLAAMSAVASLGKKSDRRWFEREVLPFID